MVSEAAGARLPSADRLREAMRRRRATGGPAERTFETLVGLELRPRRLREAAQLWAAVHEARGAEGRDDLWGHPDLLPHAEDLDGDEAIEAFVERSKPLDLSGLDDLPSVDDPQTGDDSAPPA